MAYAATVNVTSGVTSGRRWWFVSITETGASSTSEWSVPASEHLPEQGTITLYKADLTAGTGTTIQPKLGRATNPTVDTQNWIGQIAAAGAAINDASRLYFSGLTGGILYGRSTPNNAAADHSITTEITIWDGHMP